MAITLGMVEAVDTNGVYVSMPGAKGVLRGPYSAASPVVGGERVLLTQTDGGEWVVSGVVGAGQGVSVKAFGATGDGATDDTAAIQSAIDAVDATGGGVVLLPSGTYRVTGAGLDAKSVSIIGEGSRAVGADESNTTPQGSVLQGDGQTGPVLTVSGSDSVEGFIGRREFADFSICGDGVSDEYGLYMSGAHMVTLRNLVLRDNAGIPLQATGSYFVTVTDCTIFQPVDVAANDVLYAELVQVNSWRTRGLMLRGSEADTSATVGASGAICIKHQGTLDSEHNDFQIVAEYMKLAEGSLGIVDHRGKLSRVELVAWDCGDYGTVTTPWVGVKMSTGYEEKGGNLVTGVLIGRYDTGIRAYGVELVQPNNAVIAIPGFRYNSVHLASGVENSHVDLVGSEWDPDGAYLQVVDDSGNLTNFYQDRFRVQFPQTHMGFFGTAPITKPTVTGSRGGNAALASLLTALQNLGLITDSSS